jgi:hypothetical protein
VGHAKIENLTPFAFETVVAADEDGRLLYVPVVKATYALQPDGSLKIAEKQLPVNVGGELWGEPGISSYKYEPECAFTKAATDMVLIGHAHAGPESATEVFVRLRAGPLDKTVRVTGDRYWVKALGMVSMTSPEPFESIPLTYERAFGGWDRSHPDPTRHAFEPCNPVGVGFRSPHGRFEEGIRLPNLEDPQSPVQAYAGTSPPAGFGFTAPDWKPRAALAGTYDETWTNERMPLLPKDFDRRFFNAGSPGLVAPNYLKGDEAVFIQNASPRGAISFNLPALPPPECRVQLSGRRPDARVQTNLDTVIINTDDDLLLLIWRGHLALRNGPHDVASVQIQVEGVSVPAVE